MNNLASDPAYIDKKKELRRALEQWQTQYRDLGLIPETEVIKLLWPPIGEQPVTATPEVEIISKMEKDSIILSLTSTTQGASIVYRTDTSSKNKKSDRVYFTLPTGSYIMNQLTYLYQLKLRHWHIVLGLKKVISCFTLLKLKGGNVTIHSELRLSVFAALKDGSGFA